MENAGQLVFEAAGSEHRLTAFLPRVMDAEPVLFVPFRDATSGVDTYGAGRYVEVPYDPEDEVLELDFNYAYNPSCVFSPAYDCPFPPPGNRLSVAVTVGERLPLERSPAEVAWRRRRGPITNMAHPCRARGHGHRHRLLTLVDPTASICGLPVGIPIGCSQCPGRPG
jgi:hypothetical protein